MNIPITSTTPTYATSTYTATSTVNTFSIPYDEKYHRIIRKGKLLIYKSTIAPMGVLYYMVGKEVENKTPDNLGHFTIAQINYHLESFSYDLNNEEGIKNFLKNLNKIDFNLPFNGKYKLEFYKIIDFIK